MLGKCVCFAVYVNSGLEPRMRYKSGFITLYIRMREWEHGNALDAAQNKVYAHVCMHVRVSAREIEKL